MIVTKFLPYIISFTTEEIIKISCYWPPCLFTFCFILKIRNSWKKKILFLVWKWLPQIFMCVFHCTTFCIFKFFWNPIIPNWKHQNFTSASKKYIIIIWGHWYLYFEGWPQNCCKSFFIWYKLLQFCGQSLVYNIWSADLGANKIRLKYF
jgi:hypothetical protein